MADTEDRKLVFAGLEPGGEMIITSYTTEMSIKLLAETDMEVTFSEGGTCEIKLNGSKDAPFDIGFEKWDFAKSEITKQETLEKIVISFKSFFIIY